MLSKMWRFITRLRRASIPSKLVFYDTESRKEKHAEGFLHRLRLGYMQHYVLARKGGGGADEGLYRLAWERFFKTPEEFFDALDGVVAKRDKLLVLSHNQHYDFNILGGWHMLEKLGYELKKVVIDSDVFLVEAAKGGKRLVFLDTFNYFRTSVDWLGELVGLSKVKVNFKKASEEELRRRCKRDVEIIARAMISLIEWWAKEGLGPFAPTVAELAFNAYRARFMEHRIERSTIDEGVKLEQAAYRGGRCEAFRIGTVKGPVYILDVNSIYPYVMANYDYPRALVIRTVKTNAEALKEALDRYAVIADVHYSIEEPAVCVKREKLICPVGDVRAVLTTPELRLVLERGRINKVYAAFYYKKAPLFKRYVEHFYALREKYKQEGDEVREYFTKLLMNSLYEKFAQKVRELRAVEREYREGPLMITEYDAETDTLTRLYKLGSKWYALAPTEQYAWNVNVAIAAHVTAYARTVLWNLMAEAGLDNVYYVGTNALFVNQEGYERLKKYIGPGLGMLELSAVCQKLTIHGPKDYVCNLSPKMKGVPKNAVRHSCNFYAYPRFLTTKDLLARGIVEGVLEVRRGKKLERAYDKGAVQPDGRVGSTLDEFV